MWREASALEPLKGSGYDDAATNAESAALRRAAAKFGLCVALDDPDTWLKFKNPAIEEYRNAIFRLES